jgi:hypothetical protein
MSEHAAKEIHYCLNKWCSRAGIHKRTASHYDNFISSDINKTHETAHQHNDFYHSIMLL